MTLNFEGFNNGQNFCIMSFISDLNKNHFSKTISYLIPLVKIRLDQILNIIEFDFELTRFDLSGFIQSKLSLLCTLLFISIWIKLLEDQSFTKRLS